MQFARLGHGTTGARRDTGMKTMVSTAGTGAPGIPECPDLLQPGAKAGPWRVERDLGRGGMGTVYAVVHDEIGKRAALKVVHQRLMPGLNADRMLVEAKVVNQVGHPNIVDIFETGRLADGRPYIVMERLCGQSLAVRADEGKLLPDLVIAIVLQVCDALIAAHAAGVVHRDLKLDNVFLIDNPDDPATPKAKVLDWGIAKVIHHEVKHTVEGQLVGTPQYLSPEQARGQAVSPETDVYSLGVMAYELFLEQLPFEAETAAEVMAMHLRATPPPPCDLWPDIPPELQDLLLAMLAKQPDRRPTMIDVAHRLEAVRAELDRRRRANGVPCPAPAAQAPQPAPSSAPSRPKLTETELFGWRSETRRWQYAIGGLALALSGVLFYISRVGDRAASAATAPIAATAMAAMIAPPPSAAPSRDEAPDRDRKAPATAAAPAEPAQALVASTVAAPVSRVALRPGRSERAPATVHHASPPRASAPPSAPAPSPPVSPRRRAKVDPDGTLDVYR
ncbi:MAG: serine/threonine protein kinase [Deltaproteobacteria bacterium]|nr:MAG: serine/threonine protein kinase [Deltaproteobacteria bacterium]